MPEAAGSLNATSGGRGGSRAGGGSGVAAFAESVERRTDHAETGAGAPINSERKPPTPRC